MPAVVDSRDESEMDTSASSKAAEMTRAQQRQ